MSSSRNARTQPLPVGYHRSLTPARVVDALAVHLPVALDLEVARAVTQPLPVLGGAS